MRVLVAGATGAIGRPLVARLQAEGHDVAAIVRAADRLGALPPGVEGHVADAFDRDAVVAACVAARPEVVVHQLTAIPKVIRPRQYATAFDATNRLRREATPHLVAGAEAAGARRLVVQSISFVTAPTGPPVHDEDAPLADTPITAAVRDMESAVLGARDVEGLVLRYGFFYGPGTTYAPDGGVVEAVRRRQYPVVGSGEGRSSFVHVDDAVQATLLGLERGTGVLNVCDDEPAPAREWLPHLASVLGAKPPRHVPAWMARLAVGPHAVHFGETLRGNSNARAKAALDWAPAHPSWRDGFAEVLGR